MKTCFMQSCPLSSVYSNTFQSILILKLNPFSPNDSLLFNKKFGQHFDLSSCFTTEDFEVTKLNNIHKCIVLYTEGCVCVCAHMST